MKIGRVRTDFHEIAEYESIFMKIGSVRAVTGGREWIFTPTSHIYIWFASNSTQGMKIGATKKASS